MHRLYGCARADVASGVFHGIECGGACAVCVVCGAGVLVAEDVRILLSVVQMHHDVCRVHLGERAFEEYAAAHIGLFALVVGVEIHHVALPEVGEEVGILLRHAEGDGVVAAGGVGLLLVCYGEAHEDVARFELFLQRHVPKVGCA